MVSNVVLLICTVEFYEHIINLIIFNEREVAKFFKRFY